MAIKEGYIVFNHVGHNRTYGWLITHFGSKSLQDAIRYCRENLCDYAEILYGKYEDEKYNKTVVGTLDPVGEFRRRKQDGIVRYFYKSAIDGKRYEVAKNGTMAPVKKNQTLPPTPFGL